MLEEFKEGDKVIIKGEVGLQIDSKSLEAVKAKGIVGEILRTQDIGFHLVKFPYADESGQTFNVYMWEEEITHAR